MSSPLQRLTQLGQSPWYDFITRDLVQSGQLARLIADEGLRGMTSNPTIFEHAITGSSDYDDDIRDLAARGATADAVVEALIVADVRAAADVFRPVFDASGNGDGTVSMEVAPTLANDTRATIAEAERLWRSVDRPNVMIKVPGTREGLPAITHLTAAGINVNITLLFSLERYREVIEAYQLGLEQRVAAGLSVSGIHSVASFFVSRVDGQTDPAIAAAGAAAASLHHRIAIANAVAAYGLFQESIQTPRWQKLAGHGALVQRPLWASTSTKDPALPDTYYVEALIAPDTVNTIPPATWDAYRDHGDPAIRITAEAIATAQADLARYQELGLPALAERTAFLEREGVTKFSTSWQQLLDAVAGRIAQLKG